MKTVRLFSIIMAVVLLAVAVIPVAAVSAGSAVSAAVSSPAKAFADAAMGLPLLAPMSVSLPVFNVSVENASKTYACTYISQTPADWVRMRPRQSFDMKWTVQNSGGLTWHASSIGLKYLGGKKMQAYGNAVSLSSDVGGGKRTTLIVDMIAPKLPGTYTALWSLVVGKKNFCKVTIILTVTR